MRFLKKYAIIVLIIMLIISNVIAFCQCVYLNNKHSNSIVRLGFSEHNIEIYWQRDTGYKNYKLGLMNARYYIGNAELVTLNGSLYLITSNGETNLSEIGEGVYVVDSNGTILYHLVRTENTETVYATPSGKKYHKSISCAGKNFFEVPLESAKHFREPCGLCFE